jgi:hypothetical protein
VPDDPALLPVTGAEATVAPVALADEVSLLVLPLLDDALSVEPDDFTLPAFAAWLDVEASVVPFVLLALFDAELLLVDEELLLPLASSAAFLVELALFEELLLVVKSLVLELLWLFE